MRSMWPAIRAYVGMAAEVRAALPFLPIHSRLMLKFIWFGQCTKTHQSHKPQQSGRNEAVHLLRSSMRGSASAYRTAWLVGEHAVYLNVTPALQSDYVMSASAP